MAILLDEVIVRRIQVHGGHHRHAVEVLHIRIHVRCTLASAALGVARLQDSPPPKDLAPVVHIIEHQAIMNGIVKLLQVKVLRVLDRQDPTSNSGKPPG